MEYYYLSQAQDANLTELYDLYEPFIQNNTYLYLSWADQDAWKEWNTIKQPNINTDSIEIEYYYYNESSEDYEIIVYNSTEGMFEARHIAVETFYTEGIDENSYEFELSQNYSKALEARVLSIEGIFFNESYDLFNISDTYLIDGVNLSITAPSGRVFSDS
ncbi:MAG: hypothetical protein BAJALOKI1v1_1920005 [Promethearchaeota archaeon]|nr:MAG: hypothetical protein BAJALOKI1v1_1920005 [Candidatus Lokiarchaeota archaeon]